MVDKKPTHVSFSFTDTPEGVRSFFHEELDALIRAAAGLMILGYECSGLDFEARRIYFTPMDTEPGAGSNPPPKPETPPTAPATKTCAICLSFTATPQAAVGNCAHHGFAVEPTDHCSEWKPKDA